jgi:hypothetical protein
VIRARHGQPSADTLRIVLDLEKTTTLKSFLLDPTVSMVTAW